VLVGPWRCGGRTRGSHAKGDAASADIGPVEATIARDPGGLAAGEAEAVGVENVHGQGRRVVFEGAFDGRSPSQTVDGIAQATDV
jgi:hypothetical protein